MPPKCDTIQAKWGFRIVSLTPTGRRKREGLKNLPKSILLFFLIYCHQLLLSGETQYQYLSSYLVSSWSKSLSISGGDSSCSWVLVHPLGLIVKEEFKSVMLSGGWRCGELLVSSSTFAVIQRIRKSVPPQKHPHWKNTNTQLQYSLYCYSLDW